MSDFVYHILTSDIVQILQDAELYSPVVAAVAATWAILAFAGAIQIFSNLFAAIFNFRAGRKL